MGEDTILKHMSKLGDYVPTPLGCAFEEPDLRLSEFRAVRHFPVLKEACTLRRANYKRSSSSSSASMAQSTVDCAADAGALFVPRNVHSRQHSSSSRRRVQTAPSLDLGLGMRGTKRTGEFLLSQGPKTLVNDQWWSSTPLMQLHRALIQDRLATREQFKMRASTASASTAKGRCIETGDAVLDSALAKVSDLSIYYDIHRAPRTIMGLVEDAPMTNDVLQRQLYKCLNLRLTRSETDAIHKLFDNNRNGTIDGAEFASHFCKIGQSSRRQQQLDDVRRTEARREEAKRKIRWEEEELSRLNKLEVVPYQPVDKLTAFKKLGEVSRVFDPLNFIQSINMRGFNAFLTPIDLRKQIHLSFGVKLSREELSAVVDAVGGLTGPTGTTVDGRRFAKWFFNTGAEERRRVEEQHKVVKQRKVRRASSKELASSAAITASATQHQ